MSAITDLSKKKDAELRVRLAELLGHKCLGIDTDWPSVAVREGGTPYEIPKYSTSLDAVAEARTGLTRAQKDAFARHLSELIWREHRQPDGDYTFALIDASPRLQTIALILTLTSQH